MHKEKPSSHTIVFFSTQIYALATGASSGFGGAEADIWNIANELALNPKLKIRILTLKPGDAETLCFEKLSLTTIPSNPKLEYTDPWLRRRIVIARYYFKLFLALRKERGRIYFFKLASWEAIVGWLAARFTGGKYIFRLSHDWEANMPDITNKIFRGSMISTRIFLFCLRRSDLVIAQTNEQLESLRDNFRVTAIMIPNAHPMPPDELVEEDLGNRINLLWVGRTHRSKQPMLYLDLAERLPQFSFTMIMAPNSQNQKLHDQVASRARTMANVEFYPGLPSNKLSQYYNKARVVVITSEAEGLSNVLIEALKYGAPMISYNHNPNGLLTSEIKIRSLEASAGYVVNNCSDTAFELIKRMFLDSGLWTECHKEARRVAITNFGIQKTAGLYKDQIDRLLYAK